MIKPDRHQYPESKQKKTKRTPWLRNEGTIENPHGITLTPIPRASKLISGIQQK
jgi:hypothetical protein